LLFSDPAQGINDQQRQHHCHYIQPTGTCFPSNLSLEYQPFASPSFPSSPNSKKKNMTSLSTKLAERERSGNPIQVGLIGAGKFGSMFISQCHTTPGMRLAAIADLSLDRAKAALSRTGYPSSKWDTSATLSISEGIAAGKTVITQDSAAMIATPGIDVILEVTGSPAAGIRHALLCCDHKKHIVMINVEADVLAGPLLARKAAEAGIIYSMAYGDQPALIAELVDWARTAGFEVVCAGKGTKHLPQYHASTPETVWEHYGFTKEQLASGDFNPQMFNSFLDGTKSALEMAAVANACDLKAPVDGLMFPPCGRHDLPGTLRPREDGGLLREKGTVEVVSCLEIDGRPVFNDLRWGVYVVIEGLKSRFHFNPRCVLMRVLLQLRVNTKKSALSSTGLKQTALAK
jgi:predicted homoserine dehydrogenase-like protein